MGRQAQKTTVGLGLCSLRFNLDKRGRLFSPEQKRLSSVVLNSLGNLQPSVTTFLYKQLHVYVGTLVEIRIKRTGYGHDFGAARQAVRLARQMDHHEVQGQSNLFTGILPPPLTLYCS